jgi:hypothetical protein
MEFEIMSSMSLYVTLQITSRTESFENFEATFWDIHQDVRIFSGQTVTRLSFPKLDLPQSHILTLSYPYTPASSPGPTGEGKIRDR